MRIDPRLEQQLSKAGESPARLISVWATMAPTDGRQTLSAEEVAEVARSIVKRAEIDSGYQADAVHVYENLSTISLNAPARLIRELARQPEITSLRGGHDGQSIAIEPELSTPSDLASVRRHGRRGRSR